MDAWENIESTVSDAAVRDRLLLRIMGSPDRRQIDGLGRAGRLMGLGDVSKKSVPKMTLITAASENAVINTRLFIPHHVHASIGVFAAISVATTCVIPDTVAAPVAHLPDDSNYIIEHPSGTINVRLEMQADGTIQKSGIIRTARKLMDGSVFV